MTPPLLLILVLGALALGYHFYGRFVAGRYGLNNAVATPAVTHNDGVDYAPTGPFYLFGQHFSAIAAAGPIAGPILASQQFGWLPCILWIVLGTVFIGAVHDFSALVASVRHDARSIAEIVKQRMGAKAFTAIMLFIWVSLLYVILAFTDITASSFVGHAEEFEGGKFLFNPGGAVAAASIAYLLVAILMGLVQKFLKPPLWLLTLIFVPSTLWVVWLGTKLSTLFVFGPLAWGLIILAYCFAASLLPLWLLLQPRGYLGGFVLYLALFVGTVGLFFGHFTIEQPAFTAWRAPGLTGALFPFLYVTIACGACSGFHGLVASGTTSKQISMESHCKPVGFGAMLLEGFVALIALGAVMTVAPAAIKGLPPGKVYGDSMGRFLMVIIGPKHALFAATFGAMVFSTFVFDTLDVATRLSRYILQELFHLKGWLGGVGATALTIVPAALLLIVSKGGSYKLFWTLFGTSNQLLAALTLLAVTVWLKQTGKPYLFTLIPMLFVMAITLWSLLVQTGWAFSALRDKGFALDTALFNGLVSLVLIVLAGFLVMEALKKRETAA